LLSASTGPEISLFTMTTAAHEEPLPPRPPLLALLQDLPDLFEKEVLGRLDPTALALLARAGGAARAAVKRSGRPRVGGGPEVGSGRHCSLRHPKRFEPAFLELNGVP